MIKKRLTAFLVVFTFLFTLVPFNAALPVMADTDNVPVQDGKLILADFGYEGRANIKKQSDVFAYTTEFKDEGKESSMKWTLSASNKDFDVIFDVQRGGWPAQGDLKIRMYNSGDTDNGFILAICSLNSTDGWKPYQAIARTVKPGWNEVSFPRTTLDKVLNDKSVGPDDFKNDIYIRFNCGGWTNLGYTNTPGDVIYIDSVYLDLPGYGETIAAPVPSVEDGATYVENDLGNNNTYTLSFSENIWADGHAENGKTYTLKDTVSVYEYDFDSASYYETEQSYTVTAEGSDININFASALNDGAYQIKVNSDAVLTSDGKKLSSDFESIFSVGMDSVNFGVISTNPENGAAIDGSAPGYTFELTFNNELDSFDLENMVAVTRDGAQFTDYTVTNTEKTIIITFGSALNNGSEYAITLSEELADVNGFYIQSAREFTFTAADVVGADGVLFDASNPEDLSFATNQSFNQPNSRASVGTETENTLSGNATFRIDHEVISSGQYNARMSHKAVSDIKKYKYINYNIYSPEATDESVILMLRPQKAWSDDTKEWARYTLPTDWEGWKTVSVSVADFKFENGMTNYVDLTIFNIGGWGFTKAKSGYFLIDRIWVSNELPAPVSLESTEFENGACYLASDLGGDNAYSFTFSGNIADTELSNAVKVEKHNGTDFESFTGYEIKANGNKLDVDFGSALTDNTTLKITVDASKVLSETYATGSGSLETMFTVEGPSPYFKLKSSSVKDGEVVKSLEALELTFNNELNKAHHVPDYISLYCDSEKVYNAFESAIDGNKLTLKFTKEFKSGSEYKVAISPGYTDNFGSEYIGVSELSFTYGEKTAVQTSTVIFSAGDVTEENGVKSYPQLTNRFTVNEDVINLYPQNARFDYKQSTAESAKRDGYFVNGKEVPLEGMNYFNMLIYSPTVTANSAQIVFYSNKQYDNSKRYQLALNWEGWKLVSIPLTDLMTVGKKIDGILFNTGGWQVTVPTDGYVLFDAVWASADKPAEISLESTSFADGYKNADIAGEVLELKFNAGLDSASQPVITLNDAAGNEITDYEVTVGSDTVTIVFGKLSASTAYTVTVDNIISNDFSKIPAPVVMNFTTKSDGIFAKTLSYADKTVTAELENVSESNVNVYFTAYAIGEDNTLLEKISKTVTAVKGEVTTVSEAFKTTGAISDVKIFVTDSNGRFISKKYYSDKSGSVVITSQLSGSKSGISIDSHTLNVNVFDAQISLSAVANAAVVEIAAPNGDIVSANVTAAGADGKLEYYYVFPTDAPTGVYTIKASSDGYSASKAISYVSKADRDELTSLVNGSSEDDLADFLEASKEVFGMESADEEQIKDFASVIIDNGPFNNYAEALDFIKTVPVILDELNSASWAQLTTLIEENSELLGGTSNSDVKYFLGLTDKKQNAVSQILVDKLPADTYADFLEKLGEAIDEYKKSLDNGGSAGGGGGGGSSRGNSMGGSFPVVPDANTYTPIETETVFTDLSAASWATDSIMTLYKAGIVSHPTDGRFRPNDNITREEFVKMLVCAFGNSAPYSEHRFTDEAQGVWYNEYLSKAYALGITKGYPDGSFGIGESISREDMVTMCARTLELLGQNMTAAGELSFTDSAAVSDYAYAYVNALTHLGVINGMEDGTFAPKATATRAQAAKVIAKLMELF